MYLKVFEIPNKSSDKSKLSLIWRRICEQGSLHFNEIGTSTSSKFLAWYLGKAQRTSQLQLYISGYFSLHGDIRWYSHGKFTTLGVTTHSPPRALAPCTCKRMVVMLPMPLPSTEANNICKYANKDKGKTMICSQAIDTCKYCEALSAPPNLRVNHR